MKRLKLRFLAAVLGLRFWSEALMAVAEQGSFDRPPIRRFTISRATSEIVVDGRLSEPAWGEATLIDLPYEWVPGENAEPPVQTECLVTYDEGNFYVGFRAYDPQLGGIRAHLMDRDQIDTFAQDDFVAFLLDTFNDERRAYHFRVNPLGVQADAFNTLANEDWQWDAIWDSAGRLTDEGYVVEVAVPFEQLRFPMGAGELTFGFTAMRSWPRSVRHQMLSNYTHYGDACWICHFNKISGFQGVAAGHNVELDPTLTSRRSDERADFPEGDLEKGDIRVEPGFTARWGVTPSLTLDGTANPDFSQVEADVAQLEVNERFALFFPEKRPFFLEGGETFETPRRAVFTRTVADAAWGAKLTGRIGASALGLLLTRDRINNLVIPSNQFSSFDSVEQDVTGSVLRYRHDIGRASTLGVLYTGREAADYHNRVASIDARLQMADADTLDVQFLYSNTLYPDEVAARHGQSTDPFGAKGYFLQYNHQTRNWAWSAGYEDWAPLFRADSGFIPRVDVRTVLAWISRTWWGDREDWWTSFRLGPGFERTVDHQGMLTNQSAGLEGELQGRLQSELYFAVSADKEYFNGQTFDLARSRFRLEAQPAGWMKLNLKGEWGEGIDSFNTQEGDALNTSLGVELKLRSHVNVNLTHSYQHLDVPGGRLFDENLTEARIYYYFDVRKLVRLIVQYRSIDRDPSLFPTPVEPKLDRLFLQFLASYKLNPRTVIFVGYSDDYLGLDGASLTETHRTFFIKLGYAWTL